MNILINGKSVNKDVVTVNHGLNYGQFKENYLEIDKYELYLEKNEFIEAAREYFDKARDEIKADDIACKESSEFKATDYAELEDMFNYENELSEIIRIYLDRNVFTKILSLEISDGYVINSTELIVVEDNCIKFSGRTYRWPVNKRFRSTSKGGVSDA